MILSQVSGKKHSCSTALINLIDKWLKCIDNGEIIGAVFFDLRKAFDIVDYELLKRKLPMYKFHESSIQWISSYLTDRKQCIMDKGIKTSAQIVKSAVSQGSILGPVLMICPYLLANPT